MKCMMVTKYLWFLLIFMAWQSCQENIPRNRPFVPINAQVPTPDPEENKEEEIKRPQNGIRIKDVPCACNNTQSIILSSATCVDFCANKNTNNEDRLYLEFIPEDVVALSDLKTSHAWCHTPFAEGQNPSCVVQVKTVEGLGSPIEMNWNGPNSAIINITNLPKDKVHIISVKVIGDESDTYVSKNALQINKPTPNNNYNLAPLPIIPVNQYTCLLRMMSQDTESGDVFYNQLLQYHFYFIDRSRPDPIPAGTSNFLCHDPSFNQQGNTDSILFPRLQELPGVFALWDAMDPRFFDLNDDKKRDIDEVIRQRINDQGFALQAPPNLFDKLRRMSTTTTNSQVGNSNLDLGYYMKPWIGTDNLAFCPNQTHYYSSNPYFVALREIIGIDTEALYLARKAPEAQQTGEGAEVAPSDFIYVRESDVKKAWFYLKNNIPTQPLNASTVKNNKIMFFYPFNFATPYIKSSTQMTYTVISAEETAELASVGQTGSNGIPNVLPPHDRRIGCVPKVAP